MQMLNVAGVYQDSLTREWATEFCQRATRVAGEDHIQYRCYEISSLRDTGILMDSLCSAVRADVIIVSIYAAIDLPPDLYAWIEAWLPRRASRPGALIAVIGASEPLDAQARTLDYLQAVARMAQLDFISQEHNRAAPAAAPIKSYSEPSINATQRLPELYGARFDAFMIGE